ncbi:MAG: extracellular solute-binding protein [Eubacteriales bacterium]|nr:extracellular solute-binding protein [Eubacteriales bacterium]
MYKRLIRYGAVFMLCSSMLAGCAGTKANVTQNEQSNDAKETVKLKVWAEEAAVPTTQKMIDSFISQYSGEADFDIVIEPNADSKTKDVILQDVHNAADVFSFPDDQLNGLVAAGVLGEVSDSDTIKSANSEPSAAAASVGDKLYAYPMTADNGYFLYYDKNYYSEEDVKTLDRILEVADNSGKSFCMEWTGGWYIYSFFGNTGMKFGINPDGVTNYCEWNSTAGSIKGTDVANAMLSISSHVGFSNRPNGDFIKEAAAGNAIAGISGVWDAVEIKKIWGDNYGAVKLPTYTVAGQQLQMSSFTGYKMIGVNYYSQNKEWAEKLAEWLTNEDNQKLRFEERNQGPSNIKASQSDKVKTVPAITAVIEQSKYGTLQRVGNNYWKPMDEFGVMMANGDTQGRDLQEIMDSLVTGITASTVK